MDLSCRSTLPETMDDPDLPPSVYARCLADLGRVNVLTLAHAPTLRFLERATEGLPSAATLSLLDVACGYGDLLRATHRWAVGRGLRPDLAGIDLNPRSRAVAAAATPPTIDIAWQTGDVFDHAPEPRPDFIVSSLFTHHLQDEQVVAFLRWLERTAVRGWFIADLHRHAIPYYGFRWLARLAGVHRIVRADGTVSIARGFTAEEWLALLARAGVAAQVRREFPFRVCVSRLK
jgi:SAM-dependent methyltransferase